MNRRTALNEAVVEIHFDTSQQNESYDVLISNLRDDIVNSVSHQLNSMK